MKAGEIIVAILLNVGLLSNAQLQFSECKNNIQYAFNTELLSFDDALTACESNEATLTQTKTQENFDDLLSLKPFPTFNGVSVALWTGLRALDATADLSDPLAFTFLDGTSFFAGGFGSTNGQSPWFIQRPINVGSFTCVAYIEAGSEGLFNTNCLDSINSVCERSCVPTESPTQSPTDFATQAPTLSPILSPSLNPTLLPTKNPV